MKLAAVLLVFSMGYSACGVEPTAVSTARSSSATAAEERKPLEERPQMGLATPAVLILSSAVIVGCLIWLRKRCGADKLYRRVADKMGVDEASWYDPFGNSNRHRAGHTNSYQAREEAIENAYAVLGVKRSDSKEKIKKAYRELAKKVHSDKNRDDDMKTADKKMAEINAAYEIIEKSMP